MIPEELSKALADKYRLERELGQGGMAVVYLATDLKHDRRVALKVMRSEMKGILGPRFAREIKLAARLQHPHICSVYDSGETPEGELWYTMPFVEGESLRDRLTGEPRLPIPTAVRIARDAAQGLEYAHKHGTIHRDIKPENILLTEDGKTLVADFGIAKAFSSESDASGDASSTVLTEAGVSIGTPAYMSPEQRLGETVTAASDVYSLGAVLYEMLAGERAAPASSMQSLLAQMREPAPRVKLKRTEVSSALDKVIQTAMHPDPAKRFPSMAALDAALESAASAKSVSSTPVWRRPAVIGVVVLGIVAAALGWYRSHAAGRTETVALLPFSFSSPISDGDSTPVFLATGLEMDLRRIIGHVEGMSASTEAAVQAVAGGRVSSGEVAKRLGASIVVQPSMLWRDSVAVLSFTVSRPAKQRSNRVEFEGTPQWILTHRDSLLRGILAASGRPLDAEQATAAVRWGMVTTSSDAYLRLTRLIKFPRTNVDFFNGNLGPVDSILRLDPRFLDAMALKARVIKAGLDFPGWLSAGQGDTLKRDAALLTQRARQVDPTHPLTFRVIGYHALILGDTASALRAFSEAARLEPSAVFYASICAIEIRQVPRSQPLPESCVLQTRLDILNEASLLSLVNSMIENNRMDEAFDVARRAVELSPTNPETRLALVDVLRALGRETEAQAVLQAALSNSPDDLSLLWTMAESQWVLGLGEAALVSAERGIAVDSQDITMWIQASNMLSRLKRHEEAVALSRKAIARFPQTGSTYWRLGTVLWNAGRFDEAIAQMRASARLDPSTNKAMTLALWLRLAGRTGEAQRVIEEARVKTGGSREVFEAEGLLRMWTGASELAVPLLVRAMGTDTLKGRPWGMIAYAELQAGQLDSARTHLRRAMAVDSFDLLVRRMYAELSMVEGNFSEAARQSDWLRSRAPLEPAVMARQIVMHWRVGDTALARAALDTLTQRVLATGRSTLPLAVALAAVGDMPGARAMLRRSVLARDEGWFGYYVAPVAGEFGFMLNDPIMAPLRETPEYAEAVRAFRQAGDK